MEFEPTGRWDVGNAGWDAAIGDGAPVFGFEPVAGAAACGGEGGVLVQVEGVGVFEYFAPGVVDVDVEDVFLLEPGKDAAVDADSPGLGVVVGALGAAVGVVVGPFSLAM